VRFAQAHNVAELQVREHTGRLYLEEVRPQLNCGRITSQNMIHYPPA
jgi:hypothetical protein